jgi:exopolyphosphatase/pppGpp-phosphohydrolase
MSRLAALLAVGLVLAPSPARAERHGGIEIGAKGVKATVVDVTSKPGGYNVKVLLAGTTNTTLSASVASSGELSPAAVTSTVKAIKAYISDMENKHKVPRDNIYVVGSSGIFAAIEKDSKAVAAGQKALVEAVRKGTGRSLDFITVEREAELSIVGIIPREFRDSALLIDIGSGNTKGGYRVGPKKYVTFGVPYGSVTFTELVRKKFGDDGLSRGSVRAGKEVLAPALRVAVKDQPGLLKHERIYLSGGAVWALATFMRPADRDTFTALTRDDVERYHKALTSNPKDYPRVDLSAISNSKVRDAAEKEIGRVKKVFKPEQLLSGAEILKGLADELKVDASKKKLYFARYGYLGWILAYVGRKSAT